MRKISEIIRIGEAKIVGLSALIIFFIVFLVGLIKSISLEIIFKRIFISELIFVPVGLLIVIIYKTMLNIQPASGSDEVTGFPAENEEIQEGSKEKNSVHTGIHGGYGNDKADINSGILADDELSDISHISSLSTQHAHVESEKMSVGQEKEELKNMSKSSLGKNLLINNKKLINDPKLMASAVRTMMNREE